MIKLMDIIREISANGVHHDASAGEPETGYSPAGQTRILGISDSKPEPWYEKGGYSQLSFPKADDPYGGKKDKKTLQVQVIKKIVNTKEKYEGFQDAVGSWDKYGDKDYATDGFDYGEI